MRVVANKCVILFIARMRRAGDFVQSTTTKKRLARKCPISLSQQFTIKYRVFILFHVWIKKNGVRYSKDLNFSNLFFVVVTVAALLLAFSSDLPYSINNNTKKRHQNWRFFPVLYILCRSLFICQSSEEKNNNLSLGKLIIYWDI